MAKDVVRPLIVLVLFCIFTYLISVSIGKYFEGHIGVVTTKKTVTQVRYPTVTICGKTKKLMSSGSQLFLTGNHHVLVDGKSEKVNFGEVVYGDLLRFSFYVSFVGGLLCNSYSPNADSQIGTSLRLFINTEEFDFIEPKLLFYIFNTKTMLGGPNAAIFGSTSSNLPLPYKEVFNDTVVEKEFSLDVKEVKSLDKASRPCSQKAITLSVCLLRYLGKIQGCSYLARFDPSEPGTKCTDGEMGTFNSFYGSELPSMSEEEFIATTGCKPDCNLLNYQVSAPIISYRKIENGTNARLMLTLSMTKPSLLVDNEVLLYDGNNLWGDIGGFIGMLLGTSCLTLWDYMVDIGAWTKKKCNTKNNI